MALSELHGGEREGPDTIKSINYNQACNGARSRCLKKELICEKSCGVGGREDVWSEDLFYACASGDPPRVKLHLGCLYR